MKFSVGTNWDPALLDGREFDREWRRDFELMSAMLRGTNVRFAARAIRPNPALAPELASQLPAIQDALEHHLGGVYSGGVYGGGVYDEPPAA